MSNSPMVLEPAPSQLVYAGAINPGEDSLPTILGNQGVDINSEESIVRYFKSNSLNGKTEITFFKSLQMRTLDYTTTPERSPNSLEQPVLGKYIPHSKIVSVKSGNNLQWKEGETYYNGNNFQFINYSLIDPYQTKFSGSSSL